MRRRYGESVPLHLNRFIWTASPEPLYLDRFIWTASPEPLYLDRFT